MKPFTVYMCPTPNCGHVENQRAGSVVHHDCPKTGVHRHWVRLVEVQGEETS